jgi:hypothetical protein
VFKLGLRGRRRVPRTLAPAPPGAVPGRSAVSRPSASWPPSRACCAVSPRDPGPRAQCHHCPPERVARPRPGRGGDGDEGARARQPRRGVAPPNRLRKFDFRRRVAQHNLATRHLRDRPIQNKAPESSFTSFVDATVENFRSLLKAKVGEVTMANELLDQKIAALEGGRPLGRRRSRR